MPDVFSIVPLDESQREQACALMVVTSMNRLVLDHACPSRVDDRDLLRWLNQSILNYGLRYGRVLTTQDVKGLAVWFPPGETAFAIWKMIRSGFGWTPVKLGLMGMIRVLDLMKAAGAVHRETAPGAHWYLYNLTVDPSHRGRSIAKALLAPVLKEADEARLPVYLESRNEGTIPFYERLGFRVIRRIEVQGSVFWPMVRLPVDVSRGSG